MLFLAFVFVYASNAFCTATPPDSTTSIVDKTSAAIIIEDGRTLFSKGKIKNALIKFRQASVKDPHSWKAFYWVSKCHYRMNNYGYALKYAKLAMKQGGEKVNDEVYFMLGCTYHRLGSLDTAMINYKRALEALPKRRSNELLVEHHIKECDFAKVELTKNDDNKFGKERVRGDVNSGYDDYNIVLVDNNTIYFTSRRSNTMGGGMNPDDQRFYEDIYKATFDPETQEWDNVTNELGKLNSEGFDALNYISKDGLTAILTLNTTTTDRKKTTRGSDIAEAKYSNKGTWNTPKAIKNKSINTSFFEGSASLTADGNTMYFVSDRKGEKSSTDIYVVRKNGKNWGEAKALPMTVNTKGRETTPYITPDGRFLFYSSDGMLGMGGLDVYVVEYKGGSWGTPINLGSGINTVNNDSHFVYSEAMKKAFLAGYEIIGNKSSIDLYELNFTDFVIPTNK